MRLARFVVFALAVCIPVGGLGAWAFNPDSGAVLHSEALWRVFGIMWEVGAVLVIPIALCIGIVSLVRDIRAARRSREA